MLGIVLLILAIRRVNRPGRNFWYCLSCLYLAIWALQLCMLGVAMLGQ